MHGCGQPEDFPPPLKASRMLFSKKTTVTKIMESTKMSGCVEVVNVVCEVQAHAHKTYTCMHAVQHRLKSVYYTTQFTLL